MSAVAPIASQLAYCRAARRLRSRCAQRPRELYQGLRRLSEQADRAPRSQAQVVITRSVDSAASFDSVTDAGDTSYVPAAMHLTPAAMVFIPIVRESLDGPILRYSARQQLIRKADQLGIARFHANLLIAFVQHELQKRNPVDCDRAAPDTERGASLTRFAPLAAMLALECVGILALWRALHA